MACQNSTTNLPSRDWWEEYNYPECIPNQFFADVISESHMRRVAGSNRTHNRIYLNPGRSRVNNDNEYFGIALSVEQFEPEEVTVKVMSDHIVVHAKHEEKLDAKVHGAGHFVSRELTRRYVLPSNCKAEDIKACNYSGNLVIIAPKNPTVTVHEVHIETRPEYISELELNGADDVSILMKAVAKIHAEALRKSPHQSAIELYGTGEKEQISENKITATDYPSCVSENKLSTEEVKEAPDTKCPAAEEKKAPESTVAEEKKAPESVAAEDKKAPESVAAEDKKAPESVEVEEKRAPKPVAAEEKNDLPETKPTAVESRGIPEKELTAGEEKSEETKSKTTESKKASESLLRTAGGKTAQDTKLEKSKAAAVKEAAEKKRKNSSSTVAEK